AFLSGPNASQAVAGPIERVCDWARLAPYVLQIKNTETEIGTVGVSTAGVVPTQEALDAKMLPRGSAVITPSGELAEGGITHVIHAASGAMTRNGGPFEPTLGSIGDSVKNALILANRYHHK